MSADLEALAQDPDLDEVRSLELAQSHLGAVRCLLAYTTRHVSVQDFLAADAAPEVVEALACNEHLDPSVAARLSFHPDREVQRILWLEGVNAPTRQYAARFVVACEGVPALLAWLPGHDPEAVMSLGANWEGSVMSLGEAIDLVVR